MNSALAFEPWTADTSAYVTEFDWPVRTSPRTTYVQIDPLRFGLSPTWLSMQTYELVDPRRNQRVVVKGARDISWFRDVMVRLALLLSLPPGWDSYAANQVSFLALTRALTVLDLALFPDSPAPSIVPTRSGGLQLEWHRSGKDLEIEISPDGSIDVFGEDAETGESIEGPLRDLTFEVIEWMSRLS
jgi:hypothetical protein